MSDDGVDYLSASLELHNSGPGEDGKLVVTPLFDHPRVEVHIEDGWKDDDGLWIILNRAQIECLSDFLVAWLARLKEPKSVKPK